MSPSSIVAMVLLSPWVFSCAESSELDDLLLRGVGFGGVFPGPVVLAAGVGLGAGVGLLVFGDGLVGRLGFFVGEGLGFGDGF